MALEAHVVLEAKDRPSGEHVIGFRKLGPAMQRLNAASFAGIPGVLVVGVGDSQRVAYDRVTDFTEVMPDEYGDD